MRIISPVLKHIVYPGLSCSGCLRHWLRNGPAVITYHGVLPRGYKPGPPEIDGHLIAAKAFVRQIRFLKAKYNVVSPEQFLLWCNGDLTLPSQSVFITCDDGLVNTLTDMLPIVQEFGVEFLLFVSGANLSDRGSIPWYEQPYLWFRKAGNRFSFQAPWQEAYSARTIDEMLRVCQALTRKLSVFDATSRTLILQDMRTQLGISENWDSEYSENEITRRRFFMLNRAELLKMADAGVTIGAHSLSHPMLSQMPGMLASHEISHSREQLQDVLGREVWAMAFPFGGHDAVSVREPELAKQAGFKCAFMNVESNIREGKFSLPRMHVSSGMNLAEFEAQVSGFHNSLRDRYLHASATVHDWLGEHAATAV